MSNRYKKAETGSRSSAHAKAEVVYPSYVCVFMGLSPAIEELDKKFLCTSGVLDHDD